MSNFRYDPEKHHYFLDERRIATTGEESSPAKAKAFFGSILEELGYDSPEARAAYCQLKDRYLSFPIGRIEEPNHVLSDDYMQELVVDNRTVACVLMIRDDLNYVQEIYVNLLTPELKQQLLENK